LVQHKLFEALRLEIRYDPVSRLARCDITLTGDTIDSVTRATKGNDDSDSADTGNAGQKANEDINL
jgi:hypothetical protein